MPKVEDEDFIQGVFAVRDPWTWACTWCTMDPLSLLRTDEHGKPKNRAMDLSEIVHKVGSLVYVGANANHKKEMKKWSERFFRQRAVRADEKDPRTGLKFKSLIQPCVWIRMEAKGGDRELAVQLANAVLVLEYCPCVHSPKIAKAILDEIWSVPRMIAGRGKTSTHRAGP